MFAEGIDIACENGSLRRRKSPSHLAEMGERFVGDITSLLPQIERLPHFASD
jgi:hypothetical protein